MSQTRPLSLSVFAGLLLGALLLVSQTVQAQVTVFNQTLVIASDHSQPKIDIQPVPFNKDWAFTARWDDNNPNALNMHKAMVDIGIKGSFYLNASGRLMDAAGARTLASQGCSVAGHTVHHYWLTTVNPNAVFWEILHNRIEREAEVDFSINSFAFPFGTYWTGHDLQSQPDISDALVRSGYHHCVYSHFAKNTQYLPKGLFSTVNQVVPGDRKVNADRFRAKMKEILDNPEKYKKTDYSISLGVHPWQPAPEMEKFKEVVSEYAGRDDFWYCSQTEFAAYRLNAKYTLITPDESKVGTYKVSRPTIEYAGEDVPLSITLTGPKPSKVMLDDKVLDIIKLDEQRWMVNLPYTQDQQMPSKVDWLHFDDGKSAELKTSDEIPGLAFGFGYESSGDFLLTVTNNSDETISTIYIVIRKPLCYEIGTEYDRIKQLKPGQTIKLPFAPGKIKPGIRYKQGKTIVAAELFMPDPNVKAKAHLTFDLSGPEATAEEKAVMIRDFAHITGPFVPKDFDFAPYVAMSQTDAQLKQTIEGDLLTTWSTTDAAASEMFAYDRIFPFGQSKDWYKAANKFTRKPAYFVAAIDFDVAKTGDLQIKSELPIKQIAIDGKVITLDKTKVVPGISAGKHRAIMALDTKSKLVFYKPKPVFMELTVDGKSVTYR
ncbi:MAG: hypothetical protein ACF8OB_09735 [Phycisphaeraceae bacterium JB051]